MKDFKSVQDLIIKAALYDGISTTIGPSVLVSDHIVTVMFSKNNRCTVTDIDLEERYGDPEEVALYCCKRALYDLLCNPYEEITYKKENKTDD